jgi:lambda repressor-like predicted transcriptional regulator
MTPAELASELGVEAKTLRAWLRRSWPRSEGGFRWILTQDQVVAARQKWPGERRHQPARSVRPVSSPSATRGRDSDESYVVDLLDELLGCPGQRQARFPWLLGDPASNGSRVQLPVDAYWPNLALVVEYRERQHDQPTPFFDKPDRLTVSGVHRGQQRQIYDARRDQLIPEHGLRLLVVKPSDVQDDGRGRLRRHVGDDLRALRRLLATYDL